MDKAAIENKIKEIVLDFVEENYDRVYKNDYRKILNSAILKDAIEDYPGHISLFPASGFDLMRLYRHSEIYCDLDFPLWYDNKRSDLTMVCEMNVIDDEIRYTIRDILVQ